MGITYGQAHYRLKRSYGKASLHTCSCGRQALDWAYLRNDPEEKTDPGNRRPYSQSPTLEFYAPLCRSCHIKLDADLREAGHLVAREKFVNDEVRMEQQRLLGKRVGEWRREHLESDIEYRAREVERARVLGTETAARRKEDPEFDRFIRSSLAKGGVLHAQRMKEDPEYREKTLRVLKPGAGFRTRRRCLECGTESNAPGIARHQRASGHAGWESPV